ncbi:hypothetical protein HHL24_40175 [Paraburkholderia sp. RP-4-7]|uniref:Lipoprotein n=1 Tax=Paraburkholderia polaris TaxID=2728848 RepID=A0A848ISL4_9BURK|nr:hypothetical protein [Paraburkholderia polaris]NMM04066.1 hypothetical protein [Paraburkholderia polaris]
MILKSVMLRGLVMLGAVAMSGCGGGIDTAQPLPASFSVAHAMTTCLWQGPIGTAVGEVNEAYPDSGATYWSAQFKIPAGARVFLKGQFAYSRYMSFNSYQTNNAPAVALTDYQIAPDAGSTNPFVPGAARYAANRNYTVEIVPTAASGTATPNTLYANSEYGQTITVWYRVYVADKGSDATGGVGLPHLQVQQADGTILTDAQACSVLSPVQTAVVSQLLPAATYAALRDQSGLPAGFPAMSPSVWRAQYNTQFGLQCAFYGKCGGNPVRQVGYFANLDNAYVAAFISRAYGAVVVLQGRVPTTPRTFNDAATMSTGQLRYWSICSNEFYTQKATACLSDEQVPVDANGNYTIVVSRAADMPGNATAACGRGFITWSDAGDGAGHIDDGFLIMRNMLPSVVFPNAIQNTKTPGDESSVVGSYLPTITYMSTAAFETLGCKQGN